MRHTFHRVRTQAVSGADRDCAGRLHVKNVFIQVIRKPARKVIIRRGVQAIAYWDNCNEVGCDVWGTLMSKDSLCGEPVCLWLPDKYILPGTSKYVRGVEVDVDFSGDIPTGIAMLTLAMFLRFFPSSASDTLPVSYRNTSQNNAESSRRFGIRQHLRPLSASCRFHRGASLHFSYANR